MTAPFFPLCMSLTDELVVCCHEELRRVVSAILGYTIKNIWGCSMCMNVGASWIIMEKDV